MRIAEELGVEFEEVNYIQSPPDANTLRQIITKLEDPPTALVRRDSKFKKLELGEADVATDAQVINILVKHKQLLQRPLIVTDDTAIICRPKDRVRALFS